MLEGALRTQDHKQSGFADRLTYCAQTHKTEHVEFRERRGRAKKSVSPATGRRDAMSTIASHLTQAVKPSAAL